MTDTDAFVVVSDHAENLNSGRMVGPGDRLAAADLALKGEDGPGPDAWLLDEGRIVADPGTQKKPAEQTEHEAKPQRSPSTEKEG